MKKTILIGVLLFFVQVIYCFENIQSLSRQLSVLQDSSGRIKPPLTPFQIAAKIGYYQKLGNRNIKQEVKNDYFQILESLHEMTKQLLAMELRVSLKNKTAKAIESLLAEYNKLKNIKDNLTRDEKSQVAKLEREINNYLDQYEQHEIGYVDGLNKIHAILDQKYYTLEPIEQELDKIEKNTEPLHPELGNLFQQALYHLRDATIRYGTILLEKTYENKDLAQYTLLQKVITKLLKISKEEAQFAIGDLIRYQKPLKDLESDIKIHKLKSEELTIDQAFDLWINVKEAIKNISEPHDLIRAQIEKIQQTIIKEADRAVSQNLYQIAFTDVILITEFIAPNITTDLKNYFNQSELDKLTQPLNDIVNKLLKITAILDITTNFNRAEAALTELKKSKNEMLKAVELVKKISVSSSNAEKEKAAADLKQTKLEFFKRLQIDTYILRTSLNKAIGKLKNQQVPTPEEIKQGADIYNFLSQIRAFLTELKSEFTQADSKIYNSYIDRLDEIIIVGEKELDRFVKLAQSIEDAQEKALYKKIAIELNATPIYIEAGIERKKILQNPLAILGLKPQNNITEAALAQAGGDPKAGNTEDAIKAAFRKLSLKWHPNRPHEDKKLAEEISKVLQAAYERLIPPAKLKFED
jgi:hypothetical protein